MSGPHDAPGPPGPYSPGPFPPGGYPGGYPGGPPPPPPPWGPSGGTNGLAIASLVLALTGLALCGIPAIAGLICGIIAINQINNSPVRQEGKGLAIAGTIISAVVVVLMVIGFAFLLSVDDDDFDDDDPFDDDSFPALVAR
ncbi:MAG TPA: DUF4190 domain-containing protein [Acidimicrobiales bacterium]|nr:DUF4190 domain-containing protein [Acidimicrobiales bacterium]